MSALNEHSAGAMDIGTPLNCRTLPPLRESLGFGSELGTEHTEQPIVRLLEMDAADRLYLRDAFRAYGHRVVEFSSVGELLLKGVGPAPGCIVLDLLMPDPSALDLQQALAAEPQPLPIIFTAREATPQEALRAMKQGAEDFFVRPWRDGDLLSAVDQAIGKSCLREKARGELAELSHRYSRLTNTEQRVFRRLMAGVSTRQICDELGFAERTQKKHRAEILRKMEARSIAHVFLLGQRIADLMASCD